MTEELQPGAKGGGDKPAGGSDLSTENLSNLQLQCIHCMVDHPLWTVTRVAEEIGSSQQAIGHWKRNVTFTRVLQTQLELWEQDLREERLSGKRSRLRILASEVDRLVEKREDLKLEIGEEVRVSQAIVQTVEAAGKEMKDVRLGGAGVGSPLAPDPNAPDFTPKLAKWLRKVAVYMEWDLGSITLEEVCVHLEGARPVETET